MSVLFANGTMSGQRVPLPKPIYEAAAWLGIFGTALAVATLVFVVLAPRIVGWQLVVVSGGSMEPTIHFGSVAVMREVEARPAAGDVVMYSDPARPGHVITHRVVVVSGDGSLLTTRGDANPANDAAPIPVSAVRGRYLFSVPYTGRFVTWMHTRQGYLTLILFPGLLIIAWEVASIARTLALSRRPSRAPTVAGSPGGIDSPSAG